MKRLHITAPTLFLTLVLAASCAKEKGSGEQISNKFNESDSGHLIVMGGSSTKMDCHYQYGLDASCVTSLKATHSSFYIKFNNNYYGIRDLDDYSKKSIDASEYTQFPLGKDGRPVGVDLGKSYIVRVVNFNQTLMVKEITPIAQSLANEENIKLKFAHSLNSIRIKAQIIVRHLGYHKSVGIEYTNDNWATSKELYAGYIKKNGSEGEEIWEIDSVTAYKLRDIRFRVFYRELDSEASTVTATHIDDNGGKAYIAN